MVGQELLPGKSSYFLGNDPEKWITGVPSYARVEYGHIYPGIDLLFYGNQQHLEYDFIVGPHADPNQIALSVEGASHTHVDSDGDLSVAVADSEVKFRKPVIYQEENGKRRTIDGGYILTADNQVKFQVGPYDRERPLVVDPVLDYSTYLGGSASGFGDVGFGIAVDSNGDAFIAGQTSSLTFPTTSGAVQTTNPASGAVTFVTEINPTGTAILYSTYLGGSTAGDSGQGIALDSAVPPNVYVTGFTCSSNFPTTANALIPTLTPAPCNPTGDLGGTGFVTKLNPALSGSSALIYSTYLGGNGGNSSCVYTGDSAAAIAVDPIGNIYVAGATCSTNFPTTSGALQTTNPSSGNYDSVFLTRIDPTKSGSASLIYSTYLGGNAGDVAYGIVVDSSANAHITGALSSTNFPTTSNAFMQTSPCIGNSSCYGPTFLSRINTNATGSAALVYSTYLGGTADELGAGVALGPNNVAYVTGATFSPDFPVTPGAYSTSSPAYVAFLSLIDTSKSGASSLKYSTFLGGTQRDFDVGNAVAVDSLGNAYIAGYTFSPDFPTTANAYQSGFAGCEAGFISELSPLGNGAADLVYSTFFAGTEVNCSTSASGAWGIALDSNKSIYFTGSTNATDFPVSPSNAYQTTLQSHEDAYVAKLAQVSPIQLLQHAATDNGTANTSSVVVTLNGVSSRDLLTCSITYGNPGGTTLSVSDNVNGAWSVATTVRFSSLISQTNGQFYLANSKAGNITITGQPGAAGEYGAMDCQEWSGVAISNPLDQQTQQDGTTANPSSGNVTTTTSGELILGDLVNGYSPSSGSGLTLIDSDTSPGTGSGLNTEYQIQTNPGSVAATWTLAATNWTAQVATFKPATGTGGGSSTPTITSLSPTSGLVGTSVTITGTNFGSSQGSSTVNFNGTAATTASWWRYEHNGNRTNRCHNRGRDCDRRGCRQQWRHLYDYEWDHDGAACSHGHWNCKHHVRGGDAEWSQQWRFADLQSDLR
jgi:IPT/TIG domain/Beta-propeller repeat